MKISLHRGVISAAVLLSLSALLAILSTNLQLLSRGGLGQTIATSQPVEIIVDNTTSDKVVIVGSWPAGTAVRPFYGANYLNDDNSGKTTGKKITFTPGTIQVGQYDVYIYYGASGNRATNTPVTIQTVTGPVTKTVNQQKNGGFFLVGRYNLGAGGGQVTIGTAGTRGYVIADAVKWVSTSAQVSVATNPLPAVTPSATVVTTTTTTTGSATVATGWVPGTTPALPISGAPANPRIENGKKIYELYYGATIPEWGIYNYGNGPRGYQGQSFYGSNNQQGDTTRGNYHPICSFLQNNSIWGNAFFDCGLMLYWDVSRVPKDANITRAYIGLSGTDSRTEFGNHPTGVEQIPLRQIQNPLGYSDVWSKAYLINPTAGSAEANWNGASWLYWKQEPNGQGGFTTAKWSNSPSASPVPGSKTGDLSSVMSPITSSTPRISFNPDGRSMSYSTDMTAIVKGMVRGTIPNWGFVTDSYNTASQTYFGSASNPAEKFRVRVGVMPGNDVTPPAQRPRLVIETDGTGSTVPTNSDFTPPSVPTGLASSNLTQTSVTLTWSAVSTSDLAGYRLYRNGTKIVDLGKITSTLISGLTANTSYSFQLSAVDTSGNESVKGAAVTVVTLAGATIPPVTTNGQYIIDKIARKSTGHAILNADLTLPYPAKGVPFSDPVVGYPIKRISEVADGAYPNNPAAFKGLKTQGLTNGYSRYPNVNKSGRYAIAYMTTPGTVLYDVQTGQILGPITTNDPAMRGTSGKMGERQGIRWDKVGGANDTTIYYFAGLKLYKQNALIGASSEQVVFDFKTKFPEATAIQEESYGDFSDDMHYRALRLCIVSYCVDDPSFNPKTDWTEINVVFDMQAGQPLEGVVRDKWPKGDDISPDGKWLQLTSYNIYYSIDDLKRGITDRPISPGLTGGPGSDPLRGGHGTWAYNLNNQAVSIWIDNVDDWMHVFNPGTGEHYRIFNNGTELGYADYHLGRGTLASKGWIMMSIYGTYHPEYIGDKRQLVMVELKPGVTGVWTAGGAGLVTVPPDQQPRMWRLGPMYHKYMGGTAYFTEGFASIDMSGTHIYWGGNWLGTTNMELYQMTLPTNWQQDLGGSGIPYIPPVTNPNPGDTTAPGAPTGLAHIRVSATTATLKWNATIATDLAGYRLYRNGLKIADLGKETIYRVTGLSNATTYSFQVSAIDQSGNESAKSSMVSLTTKRKPTIRIDQLILSLKTKWFDRFLSRLTDSFIAQAAELQHYTTTKSSINLTGSSADDNGISRVTWQTDRGEQGTAVGTSTWTVSALPLHPGDNVVTITALNDDGESEVVSIIVTYNGGSSSAESGSTSGGGVINLGGGGGGSVTSANTLDPDTLRKLQLIIIDLLSQLYQLLLIRHGGR